MSTQNLMRIKEGRAIFMAVRENLRIRMIARELLTSWYQVVQLKYEKVIQFKNMHKPYYMRDRIMQAWRNITKRNAHMRDRIMQAWRKITKRNARRRWHRMRDYVQSSSSS